MTNQNYDFINTDNAAIILQTICKENTEIKQRAKKLAIQLLSNVNIEDVADEVYSELSCIAVEDYGIAADLIVMEDILLQKIWL